MNTIEAFKVKDDTETRKDWMGSLPDRSKGSISYHYSKPVTFAQLEAGYDLAAGLARLESGE